jgi:hypothetical protein
MPSLQKSVDRTNSIVTPIAYSLILRNASPAKTQARACSVSGIHMNSSRLRCTMLLPYPTGAGRQRHRYRADLDFVSNFGDSTALSYDCAAASLELNGPGPGEIKRRPDVETLPVARDNRTTVMTEVLDQPIEGANRGLRSPPLSTPVWLNGNSTHHTVRHFVTQHF